MNDLPPPARRAESPEEGRAGLVRAYETLLRSQSGTSQPAGSIGPTAAHPRPSARPRTESAPRDAMDLASAYDGLLKSEAAKRTGSQTPERVRKTMAKTVIVVVLVLFQLYLWFGGPR